MLKVRTPLRRLLTSLLVAGLLVIPQLAHASTYGSGSYGQCKYSTGCPPSTRGNSGLPTGSEGETAPAPATIILLNNYPEYTSATGKSLDLQAGQVVYFDVTAHGQTKRYSITIKAVTDTNVTIEMSSDNGTIEASLSLSQLQRFDVNNDGTNDIQIILSNSTNGVATLIFRALNGSAKKNNQSASGVPGAPSQHLLLWLIIFILMILLSLLIFFLIWKRRRDDDDDDDKKAKNYPSSSK